jgi:putative hemolysin
MENRIMSEKEFCRKELADENGNLPKYCFPGGYELVYATQDGGILCNVCANEPESKNADSSDPQWHIIGMAVIWEDNSIICDHCGRKIIPEYEK